MWTKKRVAGALAVLVVAGAPLAWACGPFFPERMLLDRSSSLLRAPRPRFSDEVAAIKVKAPALKAGWAPAEGEFPHATQTIEVDLAELKVAMAGKPDAEQVVKRYAEMRELLRAVTVQPVNGGGGRVPVNLAPPAGIPGEFADYFEGAIALGKGDKARAQASWERLLKRPAAERRFRSTWAAFMLARSHAGDAAEELRWYRETRALAAQGFRDELGLGAASLGQEARVELQQEHYAQAARLYLEASALEDPYGPSSLRFLSWRLLKADEAVRKAALKDATVRRVLVAHLVASDTSEFAKDSTEARLLALLFKETKGEKNLDGAERLAWIAYQRGDIDGASEWLGRAPEGSPVGAWIRSKLLARQGKLDEAAQSLSTAVAAFPLDESKAPKAPQELWDDESGFHPAQRLRAELAVLKLGRGHYTDALDLLLRSGYWRDAAHVAERVLTLDELRDLVDRSWPAAKAAPAAPAASPAPAPAGQAEADDSLPAMTRGELLRYLLGRRLARAGRWREARPYMPAALQPQLDAYLEVQAVARDAGKSSEQRSAALWSMARIERKKGMELLGTEVGPDWRVDDGQFDEDSNLGPPVAKEKLALIGASERRRVKKSAPAFAGRFHYRQVAAEHALEAAKLLPDRSPKASEMLCTAFEWLKNRDSRAARKYAAEARRRGEPCP